MVNTIPSSAAASSAVSTETSERSRKVGDSNERQRVVVALGVVGLALGVGSCVYPREVSGGRARREGESICCSSQISRKERVLQNK